MNIRSQKTEPWRRRCPNGHVNWHYSAEASENYECRSCGWRGDQLVDWKTDGPEVAHAD